MPCRWASLAAVEKCGKFPRSFLPSALTEGGSRAWAGGKGTDLCVNCTCLYSIVYRGGAGGLQYSKVYMGTDMCAQLYGHSRQCGRPVGA